MTQALLGKGVTAHRCPVRVGPVPGQPDPWPGTGHLSQVLVSAQPPSSLSHLTPSIPQGEGCNHTAQAGLNARGERGKLQERGSQADGGGMVLVPGVVR